MSDVSYNWPPDYTPLPAKSLSRYQLLDEAGVKELNYLRAMHKHLIDQLAYRYWQGEASDVAKLCDGQLDPSGRLLGEVRDAARKRL